MRQKLLHRGQSAICSIHLPEREDAIHDNYTDDGEAQRGHALFGIPGMRPKCECGG